MEIYSEFDFLPNEKIISIALHLPFLDIINLCESNRRFYDIICNDQLFWLIKNP